MRILIVGSVAHGSLEGHYARAFRQLGIDAEQFDFEAAMASLRGNRLVSRATQSIQHFAGGWAFEAWLRTQSHLDVVIIFKGQYLSARSLVACRRITQGTIWVNLNPDSPFDPGSGTSSRHVRESLGLFDLYLIWSRALIPRLAAAGCQKPRYLPFGYDPSTQFPAHARDETMSRSISFVGSFDEQRADMLEAIADYPLRIYGWAWEKLSRRSKLRNKVIAGPIYGAELRRVVTSSLANVNILRPQNAGAHNMRTFEVPAMGGLMIASRSTEQQAFFPELEASLMFDSPAELREAVRALTAGSFDVEAMRRRALELAQPCSYVDRARQVLEYLKECR